MRIRLHLGLGKPRDSEAKNQAVAGRPLTWRGGRVSSSTRTAASIPNRRFTACIKAQGRVWGRRTGGRAESGPWELAVGFSSPQTSGAVNAQGTGVRGSCCLTLTLCDQSKHEEETTNSSSWRHPQSHQTWDRDTRQVFPFRYLGLSPFPTVHPHLLSSSSFSEGAQSTRTAPSRADPLTSTSCPFPENSSYARVTAAARVFSRTVRFCKPRDVPLGRKVLAGAKAPTASATCMGTTRTCTDHTDTRCNASGRLMLPLNT